jgi:hypothetical protein
MTTRTTFNRRIGTVSAVGLASLASALLLLSDFGSDKAWGQDRRGRPTFQQFDQPQVRPQAPRTSEGTAPVPIDTASALGGALASCDREDDDTQFALPGLKGEIKLDRCYRGRRQLVCRFDAVLAEGKSLTEEFTRIVEQRYPDVGNIDDICKINFDALVKDADGAAEFSKRFTAARSEYDARTGCATKIKQSIQDVTLPDLVQAPEVLKSMMDSVDQEINRVSVVQEQVSGLATKVEASQKSIAVLQKLHRAMCFKDKPAVHADGPAASVN